MSSEDTPIRRRPWYDWRRLGLSFLMVSILAHVLFGVAATYLVVQTIQAKRKQTFAGAPQAPSAPARAVEHKVQMQKQRQTMSAPATAKRVATTGVSKVTLPAMPTMPVMDSAVVPIAMAGMGGTGVGLGLGGGKQGGTGGGGSLSLFGFRDNRGNNALVGTFYDLKQTRSGQPTNMMGSPQLGGPQEDAANGNNRKAVAAFVSSGFSEGALSLYFRGPSPLYATQIFIPTIEADDGPKSFNLANQVKPRRWIVVYRAKVSPPESGRYRFVGAADDYIVVRFNGRTVLDGGIANVTGNRPMKTFNTDGLGGSTPVIKEGDASEVQAGESYPLEILIGELPGGQFRAMLLLEKEGANYERDSKGNPLLPVFKVGNSPATSGNALPRVSADTSWSVWKATLFRVSE